ncbi:69 kDa paraflagellar rod protein [Diplonema papillatum]|nr:69 kDa paraflagellar rod protein [Diplonema papillatum]
MRRGGPSASRVAAAAQPQKKQKPAGAPGPASHAGRRPSKAAADGRQDAGSKPAAAAAAAAAASGSQNGGAHDGRGRQRVGCFVGGIAMVRGVECLVRYTGAVYFAEGVWAGVQFKRPQRQWPDTCDGKVGDTRYFVAEPRCGLFVPKSEVCDTPVVTEGPATSVVSGPASLLAISRGRRAWKGAIAPAGNGPAVSGAAPHKEASVAASPAPVPVVPRTPPEEDFGAWSDANSPAACQAAGRQHCNGRRPSLEPHPAEPAAPPPEIATGGPPAAAHTAQPCVQPCAQPCVQPCVQQPAPASPKTSTLPRQHLLGSPASAPSPPLAIVEQPAVVCHKARIAQAVRGILKLADTCAASWDAERARMQSAFDDTSPSGTAPPADSSTASAKTCPAVDALLDGRLPAGAEGWQADIADGSDAGGGGVSLAKVAESMQRAAGDVLAVVSGSAAVGSSVLEESETLRRIAFDLDSVTSEREMASAQGDVAAVERLFKAGADLHAAAGLVHETRVKKLQACELDTDVALLERQADAALKRVCSLASAAKSGIHCTERAAAQFFDAAACQSAEADTDRHTARRTFAASLRTLAAVDASLDGLDAARNERERKQQAFASALAGASKAIESASVHAQRTLETASLGIRERKRAVFDMKMRLHSEHYEQFRSAYLLLGQLAMKKERVVEAIQRKMDHEVKELESCAESLNPAAKDHAQRRDALAAQRNEVALELTAFAQSMKACDDTFQLVSGTPLLEAGRDVVHPRHKLEELRFASEAKMLAYRNLDDKTPHDGLLIEDKPP